MIKLSSNFKRTLKKAKLKIKRELFNYQLKRTMGLPTKRKAKYSSAKRPAYLKFGKNFLTHVSQITFKDGGSRKYIFEVTEPYYESDFVLGIIHENKQGQSTIARLSTGFEKDTLIIESMQNSPNKNNLLNEFRRLSKKQTLQFMLDEVQRLAKERRFKEIKIRRPQTLYWYQKAIAADNLKNPLTRKQTQANMRTLYQKVALRNGFTTTPAFFVKQVA